MFSTLQISADDYRERQADEAICNSGSRHDQPHVWLIVAETLCAIWFRLPAALR